AQVLLAEIGGNLYGRRETAIERYRRLLLDAAEDEFLRSLVEHDQIVGNGFSLRVFQRDVAAFAIKQTKFERNHPWLLRALTRCWWSHLLDIEGVSLGLGIIGAAHCKLRRTGLAVPARELREIARVRVGKAFQEVLDGGG